MKGEIEIRVAKKNELHELDAILADLEPDDYVPEVIGEWIGRGSVLIALMNGAAAGMSHFDDVLDGSVWLSGLRVAKAARRSGIGGALSRFATTMPGKTVFRLMISDENLASISVTEKAGFRRRCGVSLWRSERGGIGPAEFSPAEIEIDEMEYIRKFDDLLPTMWYAFDPHAMDREAMSRKHLSLVSDSNGSIFLLNDEAKALTPLHIGNRASFKFIPTGYVVLAAGEEKLDSAGLEQTLWTKSVGIYEYRRNSEQRTSS